MGGKLSRSIKKYSWIEPITELFEVEDEVYEPLIEVSYIYFDIVKCFFRSSWYILLVLCCNNNNTNKCVLYSYRQTQMLKNGKELYSTLWEAVWFVFQG